MADFNLDGKRAALRQVMITLPRTIGLLAVNFSKDRFRAGGWYDRTFMPWKTRNGEKRGQSGRAILVKSGRLRRSIRVTSVTSNSVTIGTDVPYAKAHNEGFKGMVTVKSHKRGRFTKKKVGTGKFTAKGNERMKTVQSLTGTSDVASHQRQVDMPKRQYLGESAHLNRIVTRKITTELLKAFKR